MIFCRVGRLLLLMEGFAVAGQTLVAVCGHIDRGLFRCWRVIGGGAAAARSPSCFDEMPKTVCVDLVFFCIFC